MKKIIIILLIFLTGCSKYYSIKSKQVENILTRQEKVVLGINNVDCECSFNECECLIILDGRFNSYNYLQIEMYIEQRIGKECIFYYE
jgi:hypothetical protein